MKAASTQTKSRAQAVSDVQLVRSEKIEWRPLEEPGVSGIYFKMLRFDKKTQRGPTILLKIEPGASYPAHNHPGGEEILVIEGDVKVGGFHLFEGDYLYTPPDGKHAVWSQNGGIALVIVPQQVEILKARKSSNNSQGEIEDETDRPFSG